MRTGQVSTEFFLYITVFMFVVIGAFLIINHLQRTEIPLQHNRIAKMTGEGFSNAILLAIKGGEGFQYNYSFRRTIIGIPYTLTFYENKIIIEWPGPYGNFTYAYSLPSHEYRYGGCLADKKLISDRCSNAITLINNGAYIEIKQEE